MSILLWLSQVPGIQQVLEFQKRILMNAIRTGEVPKHIAFIMDGNRRFAREHNLPVSQGHDSGSNSLISILELCFQLDIKAVSVYAFSIENFKRSKSEVQYLMRLIQEKLKKISENDQLVEKFGIKIIFSGNRQMLPKDVFETFESIERQTRDNSNVILNICFPYTSRDDITHSIKKIVKKVDKNQLKISDVDETTIESHLYTAELPPLDLLIRTSGVSRLSDYLLWEIISNNTEIELLDVYWPEINQQILTWCLFKWSYRRTSLNDFFTVDKIRID